MRARRSEPAPRRLLAVVVRRLLRTRSLPDDLLAVGEHVVLVRILERDVVSLAAVEDVDLAVAGERVQPVVSRPSELLVGTHPAVEHVAAAASLHDVVSIAT